MGGRPIYWYYQQTTLELSEIKTSDTEDEWIEDV